MGRIEDLTARQTATMPVPAPESGPRCSRTRLWSKAILDGEAQVGEAINQLRVGATLTRNEYQAITAPYTWDPTKSALWRLAATADPIGAADVFLNQWGRALQVDRFVGESDASYALRIVKDVVAPSTTNYGLASLIDALISSSGTRVVEGEGYFGHLRLNDGHRLNAGHRFMGFGAFGVDGLWNTMVVILTGAPTGQDQLDAIVALVNKKRAAGNRLLTVVYPPPTGDYFEAGAVVPGFTSTDASS